MNHTYGERTYSKRPDESRMHSKNPMNHHSGMSHYGPGSQYNAQSFSGVTGTGRSHSCSSPGSSASSICSSGGGGTLQQANITEGNRFYGDNNALHGQPPLKNSRGSNYRNNNHSPLSPYSPKSPQLSENTVQTAFSNSVTGSTSSPSGSVSNSSDVGMSASPPVTAIDPAYRPVLHFVNQRWKEALANQSKKIVSANNDSTFAEEVPACNQSSDVASLSSNFLKCPAQHSSTTVK